MLSSTVWGGARQRPVKQRCWVLPLPPLLPPPRLLLLQSEIGTLGSSNGSYTGFAPINAGEICWVVWELAWWGACLVGCLPTPTPLLAWRSHLIN